jgi:hypothetical protein
MSGDLSGLDKIRRESQRRADRRLAVRFVLRSKSLGNSNEINELRRVRFSENSLESMSYSNRSFQKT